MAVRWSHTFPDPGPPVIPPSPAPVGLGDVVASVAQPIARAIDVVAGTDVQHCVGCAARKAALNAAVPDLRHPLSGGRHE